MDRQVSINALRGAFLRAASIETAFDKDFYERNKEISVLTGHCYVCAVYAREIFGGELIKGFVNGESHYWNRWPNGAEMDFTSCQFGGDGVRPVTTGEVDTREFVPFERYELFKAKVDKFLAIQRAVDAANSDNPNEGRYQTQHKCFNPTCGWNLPSWSSTCINPRCGWINPYYKQS